MRAEVHECARDMCLSRLKKNVNNDGNFSDSVEFFSGVSDGSWREIRKNESYRTRDLGHPIGLDIDTGLPKTCSFCLVIRFSEDQADFWLD